MTCLPSWTVLYPILYFESSSCTTQAGFRNEDAENKGGGEEGVGANSRLGAYSNKYGTRYSQYNKTYLITLLVFACFVVIFPIYNDLSDSLQPLACEPQTYFRSSLLSLRKINFQMRDYTKLLLTAGKRKPLIPTAHHMISTVLLNMYCCWLQYKYNKTLANLRLPWPS